MKERFAAGLNLSSPDDQLAVLHSDGDLLLGEPCYRQGDGNAAILGGFDIVRRIAVASAFGGPLQKPLQRFKTEQEGAVEISSARHVQALLSSGLQIPGPSWRLGLPVGNGVFLFRFKTRLWRDWGVGSPANLGPS